MEDEAVSSGKEEHIRKRQAHKKSRSSSGACHDSIRKKTETRDVSDSSSNVVTKQAVASTRSSADTSSRTSTKQAVAVRKPPTVKPALSTSSSSSSIKRVSSTSVASSVSRKTISKRLNLRGHRVRTLNAGGLNLSPNFEASFVDLRDNLLSALEGIEILKKVKVLDLSFNEFKGPGFEPLENCKFLQQLYLAGNQITSLASLPQLPNLEFLSVAQNKLKTLSMASQPRLQVLAASKNKITTLKGFPHLPALEHLRVEENPILKMPHLEAATVLLVGPTLKKFNDRDLSREELSIARRYPPCTALCLREGWEFCCPESAADSTFNFLYEQWKENFPPGYLLKDASVDKPSEEDACCCHFTFFQSGSSRVDQQIVLRYQWFIGERLLANFAAIPDANEEVYFPKHGDINKFLEVQCTPLFGDTEYPAVFAITGRVSRGSGIPKVTSLEVSGELVEGNVIKGLAHVAWCGGTPGKGVASWLRRRWNGSPVVIGGAEDEEYHLTLDDIDSSLGFMYTPVTKEGARGEPQYKYTNFIKAAPPCVRNVGIVGDAVEGNTIRGTGDYFGGREGPSKFEWLLENKDTGDFVSVLIGTSDYTLSTEDVGRRLTFVYVPINLEGQEGETVSVVSNTVKQGIKIVCHMCAQKELEIAQKELELDIFKEALCNMSAISNESSNVFHDESFENRKTRRPLVPELITEVLARLPSKSVLRFKSVSKWFCHEIDDPKFVKLHLQHSLKSGSTRALIFRRNHRLQYQRRHCSRRRKFQYQLCEDLLNSASEEKFVTLAIDSPDLRLCGSCNGLVIFSDFSRKTLFIWNPNTRKHRIVTGPGPYPKDGYEYAHGLGYDSLSDDYKSVWIVQVFEEPYEPVGDEVWVYSFKCNVWRHIRNIFDWVIAIGNDDVQCAVAHNALHFVFINMDLQLVVVAFDLHTEQFRQLTRLPNDAVNFDLKVLGGELSVVLQFFDSREIEVWTINDYGGEEESWIQMVRLRFPHLRYPFPSVSHAITLEYSESLKEVLLPRYWRDFEWLDFETREAYIRSDLDLMEDEYWAPQFTTLLVDSIVSVGEADGRNVTFHEDMDDAAE